MKITTSQVITYLPEISGSITQVKSVLLKHRKATVNKKITEGDVIYFLRGCHRYVIQCDSEIFDSEGWYHPISGINHAIIGIHKQPEIGPHFFMQTLNYWHFPSTLMNFILPYLAEWKQIQLMSHNIHTLAHIFTFQ